MKNFYGNKGSRKKKTSKSSNAAPKRSFTMEEIERHLDSSSNSIGMNKSPNKDFKGFGASYEVKYNPNENKRFKEKYSGIKFKNKKKKGIMEMGYGKIYGSAKSKSKGAGRVSLIDDKARRHSNILKNQIKEEERLQRRAQTFDDPSGDLNFRAMREELEDLKMDAFDEDHNLQKFQAYLKNDDDEKEIVNEAKLDITKDGFGFKDDYGYEDDEYLDALHEENQIKGEEYEAELNRPPTPKMVEDMTWEERNKYLADKKKRKKQEREKEVFREATFKPKINSMSKTIDLQRTRGVVVGMKRTNMLHGLKKVLQKREEQLREIVKTEEFLRRGKKEMEECTFKPKVNTKKNRKVHRASLAERTQQFMMKKKKREEEAKKRREQEEIEGCTFQPKVNRQRNVRRGYK